MGPLHRFNYIQAIKHAIVTHSCCGLLRFRDTPTGHKRFRPTYSGPSHNRSPEWSVSNYAHIVVRYISRLLGKNGKMSYSKIDFSVLILVRIGLTR